MRKFQMICKLVKHECFRWRWMFWFTLCFVMDYLKLGLPDMLRLSEDVTPCCSSLVTLHSNIVITKIQNILQIWQPQLKIHSHNNQSKFISKLLISSVEHKIKAFQLNHSSGFGIFEIWYLRKIFKKIY